MSGKTHSGPVGETPGALPPLSPKTELEDPLAYLPCSHIVAHKKGQTIYTRDAPSTNIYLVIDGKVKICRLAEDGQRVVIDIRRQDEFFGESALVNERQRVEEATALEDTKLMTWTTAEIEQIIDRRPRLGIALVQLLAQRTVDLGDRIQSFSADHIAQRLMRSLVRLSERLGTPEDDGCVRIMPLTHELLSQWVGTSREIVTHYMNQFRRQGCLWYSRQGIVLRMDAVQEMLKQKR